MKHLGTFLLTLTMTSGLAMLPRSASAQLESVIVEAETGVLGSQFTLAADGDVQYATIQTTVGGGNPTTADRLITFTVTFPGPGVYELYARVRVGPSTFDDDSFYYANGFGTKSPTADADWILTNGLAGFVGFTLPSDKVVGGGIAQSGVWKWVKLSAFDGGEPPVAGFTVPGDALTQTFQVAGRENGLFLDKFAFGRQGVFFTVFDLDNGLPGTTEPPPPPYTPPGPPIATGKTKFLGGVSSPSQLLNFTAYWNQVTPENGGKWASVEGTRDVMLWGDLDTAYALARNNGFPFRMHTLVWGNQQPAWIEPLPPAEQLEEIHEWFAAVAARYPDIDFIDVVNEPLHDPPDGPGDGNYIQALGGSGVTGWDWVINAFRLARQYFPGAQLGINEFSVTNNAADMARYLEIIALLQAEGLIDTVGVQGHAFSTRVPSSVTTGNLNRLAGAGLPIYVTELDIDGPTDEVQLTDYQRIFPSFWEHPAVRGITLWGYRPGHWRTAQGAYIVHENGAERPAMVWLLGYVASTPVDDTPLALVRHAPVLNGRVEGSVQMLSGEPLTLNSSAFLAGNLLVPGTPTVRMNGQPTIAGILENIGSASPSDFTVTLNSGAALRYLIRRSDPADLPAVAPPPAPTGQRNVVLNTPAQSPGDFATIRNLTLNGNAGQRIVPAGTYGTFIANGGSGFTLGVAGATEPAVYNLQGLTLNGGSSLQVVGPVILNVAGNVIVNSAAAGNPGNAGWLALNVASGGVTVNGGATLNAVVVAPAGTVVLNGRLTGRVTSNRLTINGSGTIAGQ